MRKITIDWSYPIEIDTILYDERMQKYQYLLHNT